MSVARFTGSASGLVVSCPVCFAVVRSGNLPAHIGALHAGTPVPEPEPGVIVTAGAPGTVVGVDATELNSIGDLNDLGLALGAAWPTGSYIEYSYLPKKAHWQGTKFKSGIAP